MKWLRLLVVIVIFLFLLVAHSFFVGLGSSVYILVLFGSAGGIICYFSLRDKKEDRSAASKQVAIIGGILVVLLFVKTLILRLLQEKLLESAETLGSILSIFGSGSFVSAIIIAVVFSGIPMLMLYLEGKKAK